MEIVSSYIKECELELRCNTRQLAKKLGIEFDDFKSWREGRSAPDNPTLIMLALHYLRLSWILNTEPFYRDLLKDKLVIEQNKNLIDQSKKTLAQSKANEVSRKKRQQKTDKIIGRIMQRVTPESQVQKD